jgi:hypothetical protein
MEIPIAATTTSLFLQFFLKSRQTLLENYDPLPEGSDVKVNLLKIIE